MLGSTLCVGNLTDCEQIVELSVDAQNLIYNKANLRDTFDDPSLPFSLAQDEKNSKPTIKNSEVKDEAWFIENPVSKELTKRITLKLGANAE